MNRIPSHAETEEAKATAKLLARGLNDLTGKLLEIIKQHFVDFKFDKVTNGQLNKDMLEHIKKLPQDQFDAVAAFAIVQVLLVGPDKLMGGHASVEQFIHRMSKLYKEQPGNNPENN